jgi:glycosyltransferase involved in cell wall biosynthesis
MSKQVMAGVSGLTAAAPRVSDHRKLISVIVPVVERADDLAGLYRVSAAELDSAGVDYEFLFVFDGGFAPPPQELVALSRRDPKLRILSFAHGFGETAALKAGIQQSVGGIIVTLAAYFQVKPEGIRAVLENLDSETDIVVTRRFPREDGWLNRLQSSAFHGLVRTVSGAPFRDMACGLRAMRREVAESLPLYGDLHRFIPALALREGYQVLEIAVPQHPLDARPRVYRPGVYVRRLLDITAFFFLTRFTEKPLRFFGLIGGSLAGLGFLATLVLLIQRLGGTGIANRPLLLLGVLLIALGIQICGLGLVGEVIVYLRLPRRRAYRVRETVGFEPRSTPGESPAEARERL